MSLGAIFIGLVVICYLLTILPPYIGIPLLIIGAWKLIFRE